ncbi:Uncharacterised protein [Trueperella pyogenes]|nr:hypothetical protein [Trueperella pyogenes]SUO87773.1 Uncharacterised protein [Trueperella pyogenes]
MIFMNTFNVTNTVIPATATSGAPSLVIGLILALIALIVIVLFIRFLIVITRYYKNRTPPSGANPTKDPDHSR